MLDQIGQGRTFDGGHMPTSHPFGKGLNVQIRVASVAPLVEALARTGHPLFLPVEEKWYRVGSEEAGNRQFVVADPDGYLLRFFEDLGMRPVGHRGWPAPPPRPNQKAPIQRIGALML